MIRRSAYGALAVAGLILAACGPIPVHEAERICAQQVLNKPLSGEAKVGINQDGHAITDIDMTLSLDALMGRDPNEVYSRCVYNRSGQLPTRPLYSR
ncbi:hypothetical protein [Pseudothioclava arenosa]|uniref:Lipoprotein n=1 Tax=Pseudothioclava arenosa TaxID=1795308 RepID=A0A2A4CTY7_9RHOB|nr:hypothetical protein [Pseudothioclava arenosa]PCD77957.1 hypothetical protein CLN94_01190 [Pseudothioclava arenosa]